MELKRGQAITNGVHSIRVLSPPSDAPRNSAGERGEVLLEVARGLNFGLKIWT